MDEKGMPMMENYKNAHLATATVLMGEIPWTELCDNPFILAHYPSTPAKQHIPYC